MEGYTVRTELSGDPRVYSVELLTVMSGAQDIGEIIKKKRWGEWKEAGAVRMDSRVPPLQMNYTVFSRTEPRIHWAIHLPLNNLDIWEEG